MKIAIRLEPNGTIYIDKHLRNDIPYTKPPYNFTLIDIDDKYSECINTDFNKDFTLNVDIYNKRLHDTKLKPKIAELKANLANTDYKAIKYAEGLISEAEYKSIKEQRQAWRDEINQLEREL